MRRRRLAGGWPIAPLGAALIVAAALATRAQTGPPAAPEAPRLFAPGVVSTPADEVGIAFTPDSKTIYFTRRSPTTSTRPVSVIFTSRWEGGRWTPPEVASFSGRWNDFSPALSPDGSKLFFASYRPRSGGTPREDADLWVMDRRDDGWSEPRNLGAPVNSDRNEGSASVASDGTLYFGSDREGGKGSFDIYLARPRGSGYAEPENLGDAINTAGTETQPAISPDGTLLVFVAFGRPEIAVTGGFPYPRGDLYASITRDGAWRPARNLGKIVNTPATESNPTLSPDGARLFFTSERGFPQIPMPPGLTLARFEEGVQAIENGRGNIYEIALAPLGLGPQASRPR